MARSRRNRDSALPTEDASQDPLLLALPPVTFDPLPEVDPYQSDPIQNLTEVQDGRLWSPSTISESSSLVGTSSPTTTIPAQPGPLLPSRIAYDRPVEAIHCVRRKQRREVIFAKNYRRRGRGGSRKRDFWSQFKC